MFICVCVPWVWLQSQRFLGFEQMMRTFLSPSLSLVCCQWSFLFIKADFQFTSVFSMWLHIYFESYNIKDMQVCVFFLYSRLYLKRVIKSKWKGIHRIFFFLFIPRNIFNIKYMKARKRENIINFFSFFFFKATKNYGNGDIVTLTSSPQQASYYLSHSITLPFVIECSALGSLKRRKSTARVLPQQQQINKCIILQFNPVGNTDSQ